MQLVRLTRLHRTFEICVSLMLGTWVTSEFGARVLVGQRWMSLRLAFVCGLLFTSLGGSFVCVGRPHIFLFFFCFFEFF
jgi:hypothetical protein